MLGHVESRDALSMAVKTTLPEPFDLYTKFILHLEAFDNGSRIAMREKR